MGAKAQEIGSFLQLGTSANAYRGDLQNTFDKWSSSFHAGIQLNNKHRFNGSFGISIGSITGQNLNPEFQPYESTRIRPNKFFRSSVFTAQYNLHLNLLKTREWIIYLSQGFGLVRFNPKDEFNNPLLDVIDSRAANEAYSNVAIMFPTQAGVMYLLKNDFAFGIQAGLLNTMTDYLDNISELGTRSGNDNILMLRFSLFAPLAYKRNDLPAEARLRKY
ncbi:hypothetical protein BH23BAC1_BH23BAC1_13010 [soil metagenome]